MKIETKEELDKFEKLSQIDSKDMTAEDKLFYSRMKARFKAREKANDPEKLLKLKEYSSIYYQNNKEKIKTRVNEYNKTYYHENKDRILKTRKRPTKEEQKIYNRTYYLKNKEKVLEKNTLYRKKHPKNKKCVCYCGGCSISDAINTP